jgi:hypothetical protein
MKKRRLLGSAILETAALISGMTGVIITMGSGAVSFMSSVGFLYFTVQSNIWVLTVFFVFLIMDITELSLGTQSRRPNWLYMLKFVFTVSINLTLAVFFILLAPKMDPDYLVSAGNLTVHFLTPVIAAAHFLLFDIEYEVRRSHCVLCAVPPLCYFAFTMLLSLNGVTFAGKHGSVLFSEL